MENSYYTQHPQSRSEASEYKEKYWDFFSNQKERLMAREPGVNFNFNLFQPKRLKEANDLIDRFNKRFAEIELQDFNHSPFYRLDAQKKCRSFLVLAPFSPFLTASMFASAYDNTLYNIFPDEYSKEDQSKYKEAFETAVKKGVNVELLKAKLATIYNNQNKDVASKGKDSPFYNELSRTYELLGTIEMISSELSPYENCLSLGTEVATLKDKYEKLYKSGATEEELRNLRQEISAKKDSLYSECEKFDPELLKNVAESRKKYVAEIQKGMAFDKGVEYNPKTTENSYEYKGMNEVQEQAKVVSASREGIGK